MSNVPLYRVFSTPLHLLQPTVYTQDVQAACIVRRLPWTSITWMHYEQDE